MKKGSNKKQQKQQKKANDKNHGNFSKFINSKTGTHPKAKTNEIEENEINSNLNTSRLKDLRKQAKSRSSQFGSYLENAYKSTKKLRLFDLSSDEENNKQERLQLTHNGKNITDLKNDFQLSSNESDDEQYNEKLQQRMMKRTNFGGFDDEQNDNNNNNNNNEETRQKSKAEIYKEIIKKSKKMKYERQKLREENDAKRIELDSEYTDLVPFLSFRKGNSKKAPPKQTHDDDDDYMVLKRSLEEEEAVAKPSKQVKKEQILSEQEQENQDNESNDYSQSENEEEY